MLLQSLVSDYSLYLERELQETLKWAKQRQHSARERLLRSAWGGSFVRSVAQSSESWTHTHTHHALSFHTRVAADVTPVIAARTHAVTSVVS